MKSDKQGKVFFSENIRTTHSIISSVFTLHFMIFDALICLIARLMQFWSAAAAKK